MMGPQWALIEAHSDVHYMGSLGSQIGASCLAALVQLASLSLLILSLTLLNSKKFSRLSNYIKAKVKLVSYKIKYTYLILIESLYPFFFLK